MSIQCVCGHLHGAQLPQVEFVSHRLDGLVDEIVSGSGGRICCRQYAGSRKEEQGDQVKDISSQGIHVCVVLAFSSFERRWLQQLCS